MAKYKTEKRKANVGERILITNAVLSEKAYANGDVNTVKYVYDGDVHVKEHSRAVLSFEYEVIIADKPSKNERISLLESQVAELQAKVEALQKPKTIGINLRNCVDIESFKLTPNEQRKAVIERAKAFVAEESGKVRQYRLLHPRFVVNSEKRTVVCILDRYDLGYIFDKAIAKCEPDDVFNADIGKAIALGRALGLDVSEFENAVKPTEYAIGQRIRYSDNFPNMRIVEGKTSIDDDEVRFAFLDEHKGKPILDDTEAQY